jgi:uncharacterized protein with HEPN domain
MRDDRGRLQDILDAIKRIERYAKRGRPVFEEDELVHTWMIHHIQIIGEAASKLTPRFARPIIKSRGHRSSRCAMCWSMTISALTWRKSGQW